MSAPARQSTPGKNRERRWVGNLFVIGALNLGDLTLDEFVELYAAPSDYRKACHNHVHLDTPAREDWCLLKHKHPGPCIFRRP